LQPTQTFPELIRTRLHKTSNPAEQEWIQLLRTGNFDLKWFYSKRNVHVKVVSDRSIEPALFEQRAFFAKYFLGHTAVQVKKYIFFFTKLFKTVSQHNQVMNLT
jgi:hypothetical protein